jgi:hypothetical protein
MKCLSSFGEDYLIFLSEKLKTSDELTCAEMSKMEFIAFVLIEEEFFVLLFSYENVTVIEATYY